MTTRRTFVAAATLMASAAPLTPALADATGEADFLFVQSAKGMTFDKSTSKLTLVGVSPITVFFADRPERIAGNMKTTAFVPFWSTGKDSFLSDPPNADLHRGRTNASAGRRRAARPGTGGRSHLHDQVVGR